MARRKMPGLIKIGGIWHIDKRSYGRRLCESTRTGSLREAEAYLARRIDEIRRAVEYGVRRLRTFRDAAIKYLESNTQKRDLDRDARALKNWEPLIGDLALSQVHMDTLEFPIQQRRNQGVKSRTVNRELAVIRRILNLASRKWRDESGLSWLETSPLIEMQDWGDRRDPYPLDWNEQSRLLEVLPTHLARMALFKLNVGAREQEVVGLRWEWEIAVPELSASVFFVPDDPTGKYGVSIKNKEDRLLVLNRVARSVIEQARGIHPTHVFSYRGKPVTRMYNSAWKRARKDAGLRHFRVHDLKHYSGLRIIPSRLLEIRGCAG